MNWPNLALQTHVLIFPLPVHAASERHLDHLFGDLNPYGCPWMTLADLPLKFGSYHPTGDPTEPRDLTEFISRGADMMLEVQTFQYVIQNEAGEIIGEYTSTEEPPVKGEVITLPDINHWESAEVLGVTMMLSKHSNMIMLKVRPEEADRL